jgi:hypothetical protein
MEHRDGSNPTEGVEMASKERQAQRSARKADREEANSQRWLGQIDAKAAGMNVAGKLEEIRWRSVEMQECHPYHGAAVVRLVELIRDDLGIHG